MMTNNLLEANGCLEPATKLLIMSSGQIHIVSSINKNYALPPSM